MVPGIAKIICAINSTPRDQPVPRPLVLLFRTIVLGMFATLHRGQTMSFITTQPQVTAGFPSPAADHTDGNLDLTRLVVKRPAATFYMRVLGCSMADAGIADGDLVVVDRSIEPRDDDVVVAVVDGGFACKRVRKIPGGWELCSQGDGPTIPIDPDRGVEIWGVVSWTFRQHCAR